MHFGTRRRFSANYAAASAEILIEAFSPPLSSYLFFSSLDVKMARAEKFKTKIVLRYLIASSFFPFIALNVRKFAHHHSLKIKNKSNEFYIFVDKLLKKNNGRNISPIYISRIIIFTSMQ